MKQTLSCPSLVVRQQTLNDRDKLLLPPSTPVIKNNVLISYQQQQQQRKPTTTNLFIRSLTTTFCRVVIGIAATVSLLLLLTFTIQSQHSEATQQTYLSKVLVNCLNSTKSWQNICQTQQRDQQLWQQSSGFDSNINNNNNNFEHQRYRHRKLDNNIDSTSVSHKSFSLNDRRKFDWNILFTQLEYINSKEEIVESQTSTDHIGEYTVKTRLAKSSDNNDDELQTSDPPSDSPSSAPSITSNPVVFESDSESTESPTDPPKEKTTVDDDDDEKTKRNSDLPSQSPSTRPIEDIQTDTLVSLDKDDDDSTNTESPTSVPVDTPTEKKKKNTEQTDAPTVVTRTSDIDTISPTMFDREADGVVNVVALTSCSAHPACADLAGNCCPNDNGLFLLCCEVDNDLSEPPSLVPSSGPSAQPSEPLKTSAPTKMPSTLEPSSAPITKKPTKRPTRVPSKDPTVVPSMMPSATPTATKRTTKNPSRGAPTTKPESTITPVPVPVPTAVPVPKPSSETSDSLAPSVSIPPTITVFPTKGQYEYNKTSLNTPDVLMQFTIASRRRLQSNNDTTFNISTACEDKWRTYVEDRIEAEVDRVVPDYETLTVEVDNVAAAKRTGLLILSYDVLIDIRSGLGTFQDVERYIEGPFDSDEEKDELITYLKSTNCSEFKDVQWVSVAVPAKQSVGAEKSPDSTKDSNSRLGLIIGLSVAIGAVIMVTIAFLIVKTRKRRHMLEDDDEYGPGFDTTSGSNRIAAKDYEYVSEIGVDANQDVSTLGDPLPPGYARSKNSGDDLSTLESYDAEYDYRKAYLDVHSTSGILSELTGPQAQDINNDDGDIETVQDTRSKKSRASGAQSVKTFTRFNSVQEPYEVLAPAGLLGLVIESDNDGGFPIVHSIKKESVLFGVVKEGDCVLSIDGQDVSSMNAGEASMLIASKKNQPVRKFVFSRIMTP